MVYSVGSIKCISIILYLLWFIGSEIIMALGTQPHSHVKPYWCIRQSRLNIEFVQ